MRQSILSAKDTAMDCLSEAERGWGALKVNKYIQLVGTRELGCWWVVTEGSGFE